MILQECLLIIKVNKYKNAVNIHYEYDTSIIGEILKYQKKEINGTVDESVDTVLRINDYNDTIIEYSMILVILLNLPRQQIVWLIVILTQ